MTAALTGLAPGARAALIVLAVGAVCLALGPQLPWLIKWPDSLTVPATDWIGAGLTWFLEGIKPAARVLSAALAYPMRWANMLFVSTPWPLMIGVVTAIGWYLGGWSMAALGLAGLSFVLASGYWVESMNTLALVAVSVPLALSAGLAIGILANEVPSVKRAVQVVLDVMQTVPTFAYLTPLLLLFGFGPVVGLIASAIYAAPPMARNVILGLERVEPEIKEAAIMSGGARWQQLFLVEIPTGHPDHGRRESVPDGGAFDGDHRGRDRRLRGYRLGGVADHAQGAVRPVAAGWAGDRRLRHCYRPDERGPGDRAATP